MVAFLLPRRAGSGWSGVHVFRDAADADAPGRGARTQSDAMVPPADLCRARLRGSSIVFEAVHGAAAPRGRKCGGNVFTVARWSLAPTELARRARGLAPRFSASMRCADSEAAAAEFAVLRRAAAEHADSLWPDDVYGSYAGDEVVLCMRDGRTVDPAAVDGAVRLTLGDLRRALEPNRAPTSDDAEFVGYVPVSAGECSRRMVWEHETPWAAFTALGRLVEFAPGYATRTPHLVLESSYHPTDVVCKRVGGADRFMFAGRLTPTTVSPVWFETRAEAEAARDALVAARDDHDRVRRWMNAEQFAWRPIRFDVPTVP